MTHKGTQRIETKRLVLRKFVREDAPEMFENWASDPQVTKFLRWPPHGGVMTTEKVLSSWIAEYGEDNFYQWAIELKEIGEPIGSISVVEQDDSVGMVEVGYCIGKKWWHQGITSEALAGVMRFLFDEVGARRIQAKHDVKNPNSGAVMKKCGMHLEGTIRQADLNQSGVCDVNMYSILRSEYYKDREINAR